MGTGTTSDLRAVMNADPDNQLSAEGYYFYVTADVGGWGAKTALVGNGHCVALVREATGAPPTGEWVKGPKVKGNQTIPKGSAIATFNAEGKYANQSTGNHAAIFISVSDAGIVVLDQWVSKDPAKPSERTIRFKNGVGSASNDGDQFSLILTQIEAKDAEEPQTDATSKPEATALPGQVPAALLPSGGQRQQTAFQSSGLWGWLQAPRWTRPEGAAGFARPGSLLWWLPPFSRSGR